MVQFSALTWNSSSKGSDSLLTSAGPHIHIGTHIYTQAHTHTYTQAHTHTSQQNTYTYSMNTKNKSFKTF